MKSTISEFLATCFDPPRRFRFSWVVSGCSAPLVFFGVSEASAARYFFKANSRDSASARSRRISSEAHSWNGLGIDHVPNSYGRRGSMDSRPTSTPFSEADALKVTQLRPRLRGQG